jgi:hypothetical protein
MRGIIGVALALWACGTSKETGVVVEPHRGGAPGSATPAPANHPAPIAGEVALAAVYDEIEAGDAWKSSVMKVVAVAGPPNIVEDQGPVFDWFAAGKDTCTILQLGQQGEFVGKARRTQFGEVADEYPACTRAVKLRAKLPALADPRPVDVAAPARAVMAAWHDGQFQRIIDEAHPALRASHEGAELAHQAKLFVPVAGKFVSLGTLRQEIKEFSYIATGPAVFDKGTLTVRLAFQLVDGQPRLSQLDLQLPRELQRMPDNAAGEQLARRALDAVLARKFADVLAMGSDDMLRALRDHPDGIKDVEKVAQGFGKIRAIELRDQQDCEGKRCVTYDVAGTKARGTAEIVVVFAVSEWEVAGVHLTPAR